jgi:AcrR family transcriptional regulator
MGRPANAEGRQTRAAFMNAALELFSQKGYFGTSLRDIAKVVGVRESALYNHFSSKDQLFEALISAASEERIEQFHEITEGPVDDVRRLLETIVLRTLESFRQPRQEQLFRILMADGIRLTRDGRLNLMERLSAGQVLMRQLFVRLMREGHLRTADPDVLMLAFTGPMLVWRQLNAIGADHSVLRAPAAFARGHVDQFLQGAVAGRVAAVNRPAKPRRTVATRGATRRARAASAGSAPKSDR